MKKKSNEKVWRPPGKKNWLKNISLDLSMSSHSSARKVVNICKCFTTSHSCNFLLKKSRAVACHKVKIQSSDTLCTCLWKFIAKWPIVIFYGKEKEVKVMRWYTHMISSCMLFRCHFCRQETSMLENLLNV